MKNISTKLIRAEYQYYVEKATGTNNEIDWNKLVDLLCVDGDWTIQGAETLVAIVQNYGSFVLKNALALAIATNIEDGELGL
ncbi:MAG: hypothetical protein PHQ35_03280 [Phycisphaerae bacterium]|nr:hypothetical protein [Phycisphaerae bacterium]MDD5380684.1 hypothetical protein [Phycisphaerae bacterium]